MSEGDQDGWWVMHMSPEEARREIEVLKNDGKFVGRYLDGNKEAFQYMRRLMKRACPPHRDPGD
jgi:hypothetical protein